LQELKKYQVYENKESRNLEKELYLGTDNERHLYFDILSNNEVIFLRTGK